MAARVERQLADAIESLQSGSPALIAQILRHEAEVNGLERAIDEITGQIIARRQPAARDLRLVMSLLGATTDLERVGDESKKIALYARSIFSAGRSVLPRVAGAAGRWRTWCTTCCARRRARWKRSIPRRGRAGAPRPRGERRASARCSRRLAGFMVEDPRSISACLDILFVAKSLERIGDHAKNLGEHVGVRGDGQGRAPRQRRRRSRAAAHREQGSRPRTPFTFLLTCPHGAPRHAGRGRPRLEQLPPADRPRGRRPDLSARRGARGGAPGRRPHRPRSASTAPRRPRRSRRSPSSASGCAASRARRCARSAPTRCAWRRTRRSSCARRAPRSASRSR